MYTITAEVSAELTARGLRLNNDTEDKAGEYATLSNGTQVWVSRVIVNPLLKSIRYDRKSKDFGYYINGELAGYAPTYLQAEAELNQIAYCILEAQSTTPISELTVEEVDEAIAANDWYGDSGEIMDNDEPATAEGQREIKRLLGITDSDEAAEVATDQEAAIAIVIENEQRASDYASDYQSDVWREIEEARRAEFDDDVENSIKIDESSPRQYDDEYAMANFQAPQPQPAALTQAICKRCQLILSHHLDEDLIYQLCPACYKLVEDFSPAALTQSATALVDAATFGDIDSEAWDATHSAAVAVQALITKYNLVYQYAPKGPIYETARYARSAEEAIQLEEDDLQGMGFSCAVVGLPDPQPTAWEIQIRRIAEAAKSCCVQYPAWGRAIDAAVILLLDKSKWSWDGEVLTVFGSQPEPYRVSHHTCQCKARACKIPCKHRAAWGIIRSAKEGIAA